MIAVVTGASGFIGRNLVGRLQDEGHEVRCLVRPMGGRPPAGVKREVVGFDEPLSLHKCRALENADVVFHLIGATRARSRAEFVEANVTTARNLLGALVARRLAPRFIYVSSLAAAGPAEGKDRPVTEEDLPRPVEEYGRSKLDAERVVLSFGGRVPVTVLRPCAVFGPHDRDFLRLFRLARRGLLVYPGVARHWLSLLHVDDVVGALMAAATAPASVGQTLFVASDAPVQWQEFGSQIESSVGRRATHVNIPGGLVRVAARIGDIAAHAMRNAPLLSSNKAALSRYPYWVCSNRLARDVLQWKPMRSLPEAVRDTYLWYDQSGWLSGSSRAAVAVA